jgi:hypothetical protein
MKFTFMHSVVNEDGNRIEWWSVDERNMIVLPYEGRDKPLFGRAVYVEDGGETPCWFSEMLAIHKLEKHMIDLYKQQEHEQQI